MKGGLDIDSEKKDYPQLAMIPFESDRGWMATLHEHEAKKFIYLKGSLEKVMDMCTSCLASKADMDQTLEMADTFAQEGLRVLAFAFKEVPPKTTAIHSEDVESGVVFAGIQGMVDPPRPEAIRAIEGCKNAGIRVVMITGDHSVTALAIANKIGIGGEDPQVLRGVELETMDDDELFLKVKEVSIYARVAPNHKLRIVQQLIRHGEIVAVTGDGVNDAPALKAAHIGISMGKGGTDVAKEASDMILTDDNFATIFSAVEEGRVVYDNIRKAVFFLIPTGIAAIISIAAVMILGMPVPFVAAQLLWINLVTNGLQDVALAFEPGEKDILKRPPRNPKEGIMSKVMIQRSLIVGVLISIGVVYNYTTALENGQPIERARAVAVTTMVFFQFFQAWNSRSERESIFKIPIMSNPFLFYSMIAAFFAHLTVLYVPTLQYVFRTMPLTPMEWVRILLISFTVVIVVEIDKWIRRKGT
jgi:Ca2+-transporting ATPase